MILEESIAVKSYIDDWFLPTDIWVHTYIYTYIHKYIQWIHTARPVRTKPHTTSNTDSDTYKPPPEQELSGTEPNMKADTKLPPIMIMEGGGGAVTMDNGCEF